MRSLVPAYFLLVTGLCEREREKEGSGGFLVLTAAANVVEFSVNIAVTFSCSSKI